MNGILSVDASQSLDSVELEAGLDEILLKFQQTGRQCLPVVDSQQRCFGVISSHDITKIDHTVPSMRSLTAWEFCSHSVVEVSEGATALEVASKMLHHRVRHVIVTKDGKITGLLSSIDVIRHCVAKYEEEAASSSSN